MPRTYSWFLQRELNREDRKDIEDQSLEVFVAFAVHVFIPSLQVAHTDCMQALPSLNHSGQPRLLVRKALVSCQVPLFEILLVATGLFFRSCA